MNDDNTLHEVLDPAVGLIRFCGSARACVRFVESSQISGLIVRVAGWRTDWYRGKLSAV